MAARTRGGAAVNLRCCDKSEKKQTSHTQRTRETDS